MRALPTRSSILALVLCLAAGLFFCAAAEPLQYGPPRKMGVVENSQINESSGLARSIRNPGALWTHNDSGDVPRVFLIGRQGETLARFVIRGARAVDWEDMASFTRDDQSYLLLADTGDNDLRRRSYRLYVVEEPEVEPGSNPRTSYLRTWITIPFTYEDGPHNCEAVAVDSRHRAIYLVSKEKVADCTVYELPWPQKKPSATLVAHATATLKITYVTAMDISPDAARAVVLTYSDAYEYPRRDDESWAEAFARAPRRIPMPPRDQGESICYGADGRTLYLTSEGVSQPLWEVPVIANDGDTGSER